MTTLLVAVLLLHSSGEPSAPEAALIPPAAVLADATEPAATPEWNPFRPVVCPTFRSGLDEADWPDGLERRPPTSSRETLTVPLTSPDERFIGFGLEQDLDVALRVEPLRWPARIDHEAEPPEAWPVWSLGRMLQVRCR